MEVDLTRTLRTLGVAEETRAYITDVIVKASTVNSVVFLSLYKLQFDI